jgi:hypothetical protein
MAHDDCTMQNFEIKASEAPGQSSSGRALRSAQIIYHDSLYSRLGSETFITFDLSPC